LLDVDPGQKPEKLGLTFRAGLSEDRLEGAAQVVSDTPRLLAAEAMSSLAARGASARVKPSLGK
jgi:hypothetical protein